MTFEVPASKASLKQNQFQFKIAGTSYSAPKAKFLPVGVAEQMKGDDATTVMLDVFGKVGTPQGDAVRALDGDQLTALLDAWQADSGVGVGESGASSS